MERKKKLKRNQKLDELKKLSDSIDWTITNPRKKGRFKLSMLETHGKNLNPYRFDKSKMVRTKVEALFEKIDTAYKKIRRHVD